MNFFSESASVRSQSVERSPPFACSRCWRRKKKCDRAIPQCQLCASVGVICTYASQPPGTSILKYTHAASTVHLQLAEGAIATSLDLPLKGFDFVSNNQISMARQCASDWLSDYNGYHKLIPQSSGFSLSVHAIFKLIKTQINGICNHYLLYINNWMPVVPDSQLHKHLKGLSSDEQLPTETTLLLLCIYLVTDATSFAISLSMTRESLYCVIKQSCSTIQAFQGLSTSVIQAFTLIAVYEHGQNMSRSAYLSIGACARMGYALNWHKTLEGDYSSSYIGKELLEEQRTAWWCIIVLERILALDNAGSPNVTGPLAIPNPGVTDLLPGISQSESLSLSLSLGKSKASASQALLIEAASDPFARTAQASHLLSCVFEHISAGKIQAEDWYREADGLDASIQAFMFRTLEQSSLEDQELWHHACTAYFLCTCALLFLHKHHRSITCRQKDSTAHANLRQKGLLTLQAMSRSVIQKTEYLKDELFIGENYCPPLCLSYFRDAALFSMEMSRRGEDEETWAKNITYLTDCLTAVGRRWTLARSFLGEIKAAAATSDSA